jgi:hypothetical protein
MGTLDASQRCTPLAVDCGVCHHRNIMMGRARTATAWACNAAPLQ